MRIKNKKYIVGILILLLIIPIGAASKENALSIILNSESEIKLDSNSNYLELVSRISVEEVENGIAKEFIFNLNNNSEIEFETYNTDVVIEDDKSVTLYDDSKKIIGVIDPVIIENNTVKVIFENGKLKYSFNRNVNNDVSLMVYADNTFSDFFNSSSWITRDGMISLSLYHKDWAYTGMSTGLIRWSWDTVVEKHSGDSEWYNEEGLFNQYWCHADFAPTKNPWNIEPSRPNVSVIEMIKCQCNP